LYQFTEVFGSSVMRRVDYATNLELSAIYARRAEKKRSGFLDVESCLRHFERSGITHIKPSFRGSFDEALMASNISRNASRGNAISEGNMLTLAGSNLRIKHKSDAFILLETKSSKVVEKEEHAALEEKRVHQ